MVSKNHGWHKAWQRPPSGRLRHISGAEFIVSPSDGYTDINVAPETLGEYQAFELARGVPLHDLAQRLMRLAREAHQWHKDPRNR
jgi:hypothetical protein